VMANFKTLKSDGLFLTMMFRNHSPPWLCSFCVCRLIAHCCTQGRLLDYEETSPGSSWSIVAFAFILQLHCVVSWRISTCLSVYWTGGQVIARHASVRLAEVKRDFPVLVTMADRCSTAHFLVRSMTPSWS
jgi:hypothetical protein